LNKLALFLLVMHGSLCAQSTNEKELWSQIKDKNLTDTTRILKMLDLSYKMSIRTPDSSYLLAENAMAIARSINFTKGVGRANRLFATFFRSRGEIPKALIYCDSAIFYGTKANDLKGIASGRLVKGLIYQEQGKFNEALELDFSALKSFQRLGDLRNISVLYQNIGLVHYDQKNYKKAIEYLSTASRLVEAANDKPLAGKIYGNLGYVYQVQNDLENALTYQFKSLEILEQAKDYLTATYPYNSLAEIYLIKHEFSTALRYIKKGLAIAEKGNYEERISDLSKTYAQYCIAMQNYKKALNLATRAEMLGRKVQNVELVRNAYEQKYLAANYLGDFKEALKSYQLFRLMKDSMQDDANRRNSLSQEFTFQEEKLKLENQALATESKLKGSQLRMGLYFLFVVFLLALAIGYFALTYYRSFRKNKRLKDQIQQQNEDLQAKQEEISAQNEELVQSHEEISAHRDLVAKQYQELERAKVVIDKQNLEIKQRNFNLSEEVEIRTRELLDYNKQLEQFAFVSSHNLRAPVARILGLGKVLELSGKNVSDEPIITSGLIQASKELDRIVTDLTTILDIKKGTSSVTSKVILEEELPMLLINLEKEILDTHAVVTWDFTVAPIIHTVRPYLDSIILNLVSNSIKYRNPDRTPRVHLKTELRDEAICLIVTDNGLGIDLQKHSDKLFNLYSRFHFHVDGKGLGLHIVKTQVAALGGWIEVDSKLNEGITFFIYFRNLVGAGCDN